MGLSKKSGNKENIAHMRGLRERNPRMCAKYFFLCFFEGSPATSKLPEF